ncbi:MAG TPA: hypothetical protein VJP40_04955 [bacterium]|nr:hypothetical protein [bacterium]
MFPRVLGYLAGRAAAETYRFFSNPENRERAAIAAIETAAFVVLPPAARPLAAAYRAWNLFFPRQELPLQNPRPTNQAGSGSPQRAGLECYLGAMQAGDPWLVSPVGTMPLESCLRR